jgi:hypothetical protein
MAALADAPAASATSVCNFRVDAPAQVSIGSAFNQINYVASTNCTAYAYVYVNWLDVYGGGHTSVPSQQFLPGVSSMTTLYRADDGNHMGAYHSALSYANDSTESVALTTTYMSIKYSTLTYFSPVRRGAAVYVNILAKQYRPSAAGYGASANRQVFLQRYIGGGWQTMLGHITADNGSDTFGFIQSRPYPYRVVTVESAVAWSRTSGTSVK